MEAVQISEWVGGLLLNLSILCCSSLLCDSCNVVVSQFYKCIHAHVDLSVILNYCIYCISHVSPHTLLQEALNSLCAIVCY